MEVAVDGSRRVTLRNRRFLRKIFPVCRQAEEMLPEPLKQPTPSTPSTDTIVDPNTPIQPPPTPLESTTSNREDNQNPHALFDSHPILQLEEHQPRRTTRSQRPLRPLLPKLYIYIYIPLYIDVMLVLTP